MVSFAQFAVLESELTEEDATRIDRVIIDKARKSIRIGEYRHERYYLSSKQNIRDGCYILQVTDLEATARELECGSGLNGNEPHCGAVRARFQVWTARSPMHQKSNTKINDGLIEGNVKKLAKHGIFLRDQRQQICNVMVDIIS